jgi:Ca2+-binding EF-hand superfamily protein
MVVVAHDDVRAHRGRVRNKKDGSFRVIEEVDFFAAMHTSAIDAGLADEAGNHDGSIDFREFCRLIRDREEGLHSDDELRGRFAQIDYDGSGSIGMHEYIAFALRDALLRSSQRVIDLFRKWDADSSGAITKPEFRKVIQSLGFVPEPAVISALFDSVDVDHNGAITYEELNHALRHGAGSKSDGSILTRRSVKQFMKDDDEEEKARQTRVIDPFAKKVVDAKSADIRMVADSRKSTAAHTLKYLIY